LITDVVQDGWLYHHSPSETAVLCFNSLSSTQGIAGASKFGRHSSIYLGDALTYPGYKDVPSSWFFCEDDLCVVPEVQQVSNQSIAVYTIGTLSDQESVRLGM
jgi:hypothetical protein